MVRTRTDHRKTVGHLERLVGDGVPPGRSAPAATGYWAKLAAGKKVARPALPPRGPGMSDQVVIGPV